MKKVLLVILLTACSVTGAEAQQTDEQQIKEAINTMFDGMRAGDSAMVASVFTRDAVMQSIAMNREGEVVKISGSLDRFLTAVGTPHDEVWDEQISGFTIQIDGDLASVWTPYKFILGGNFSHCGVNSFQMAKLDGKWKVIYIVDTRRRTECIE